MRRRINELLWTGQSFQAYGLVSLKDILEKEDCNAGQEQPEEYIMLTNIVDEKASHEASDKDRRLIVHRTRIDFNR